MKKFEGRSFFIKDKKELVKVKRAIRRSSYRDNFEIRHFVEGNETGEYNHLIFSGIGFILVSNHNSTNKNYSISTLQRLLKQC